MLSTLFHENHSRSVTKAITFRIFVVLSDIVVIYFITHQVSTTAEVIVLSNITSTMIYYFHERGWNKVKWGKGILG